jgi:3-isopropylmalate/(R)-2-methylmalate dehydratase small subunit
MEPFTTLCAVAVPYFIPDIDTDKIIPHRFLRKPLSAGYRNFLFYNERFTPEGKEKPEFILHQAPYRGAGILVGGRNFGCGSTREGAVYAFIDFGIRAVIAPSFSDIYEANCLQNGLLPVVLPEPVVEKLCQYLERNPGAKVTIDLQAQTVVTPDGVRHHFEIEASRKDQLLKGLDDVGLTLEKAGEITAFEKGYHERFPWLADGATSAE